MNRRDILKATMLTAGIIFSGRAFSATEKQQVEQKINRLINRETPSMMEKKHVPALDAPASVKSGEWFNVKVNVGYEIEHPSKPGHWITEIKLIVDGVEIAKARYNRGGVSASEALFRVRLNKNSRLEAIEHCNLHGTWISGPLDVNVV